MSLPDCLMGKLLSHGSGRFFTRQSTSVFPALTQSPTFIIILNKFSFTYIVHSNSMWDWQIFILNILVIVLIWSFVYVLTLFVTAHWYNCSYEMRYIKTIYYYYYYYCIKLLPEKNSGYSSLSFFPMVKSNVKIMLTRVFIFYPSFFSGKSFMQWAPGGKCLVWSGWVRGFNRQWS